MKIKRTQGMKTNHSFKKAKGSAKTHRCVPSKGFCQDKQKACQN